MIRARQALAEMGTLSILFCIILAASTCTVVSSDSQSAKRGAQQLTEELLRDKRDSSSSSESKSEDGLGAVVAQLVSELSSLKEKQHALESELRSTKSELQSTKSDLQSTKSDLQSTKSDLQSTKSQLQSTKSELKSTKSQLQSTKSDLQSTKSQLQSTKSDLQSTKSDLQSTKSDLQSTKSQLQSTKSELQSTKSQLQSTKSDLQATKLELQTAKREFQISQAKMETKVEKLTKGKGSSFIRWGRKTCPITTALVYTGVAGGKMRTHKGSGTNPLCLTRTPQFDNTAKPPLYGYLYGAEYEDIPKHDDHDVPCSVCLAPQSTTIMVPATLTCPRGWTRQYTGHLTASSSFYNHYATEYVCLDRSLEDDSSGVRNDNGLQFYYVVTVCGSLPCPPYINDTVVTCVVCSK